jgi:hypothetical protein
MTDCEQKIRNYTPHTIHLHCNGEQVTFPSHGVARVAEEQTVVRTTTQGYEIRKTLYKQITGLPEPVDDTLYVVSIVVAQANARAPQPRPDLLCPDTGLSCLRDERGTITGITGFVTLEA